MSAMIGLNEPYAGGDDHSGRPSETTEAGPVVATFLPPLVESVFAPGGPLVRDLGLEPRTEQSAMALAVAQTFAANEPLLFEAGTGVGKSLAYLLPGIIHAVATKRPFIVSSHTIALQEQILHKDLELCRRLFERIPELQPFREFKTALLVGRGNYLCGTRLAQAIETKTELFPTDQMAELERLAEWSLTTETGLLQELIPAPLGEVWEWVNSDGSACSAKRCTPENCFYRRAMQKVRQANLVIVNHSLLFALLGGGMHPRNDLAGVLFPNDFVVLDEAHRVPSIATEHFGERISSYGFNRLLGRLYSTAGRGKKARGLLSRIGNDRDREAVRRSREIGEQFFTKVREVMLEKNDIARCRFEDWAPALLDQPLRDLVKALGDTHNRLEDGPIRDELHGLRQQVGSYAAGIRNCLSLASDDHVYWVEKSGRKRDIVTLRSAPIDVSAQLNERLFTRKTGVVLTSATLAEGRSMESFQAKVGAWGATAEQVFSPFDFRHQMRVFLATDAPEPTRQHARLDAAYLQDMIRFCALRVRGGSLVLFTSYRDLRRCAEELAPIFGKAGRPFYQQGRDGSRQELAERLRRDGNGILFGTESFWTGVDVPGPSLSQVIITRLPFENPSHPVLEAKAEHCRDRGGQPFTDITLPDALIKFRQGIGRLIRRSDDCGTITLLDSRIVKRPYGREFLAVLPECRTIRFSKDDRDELFQPLEAD
jgi:ATP-dependent DNA helicase DinG